MTFTEVILGNSPFTLGTQFGHRTRLYELDFQDQPENIVPILNKSYELGVHQILYKSHKDLRKAIELSIEQGCDWKIMGIMGVENFENNLKEFEELKVKSILLDGLFVDDCIENSNFDKLSEYLNIIKEKGFVSGIETRIPFKNLEIIVDSSFIDDFDIIMIPLNFYGYMMDCNFLNNENKNKLKILLEKIKNKKIIANRTLATGILQPLEAYTFIKSVDYLDGVCVGIAKISEAEETFSVINEIKS